MSQNNRRVGNNSNGGIQASNISEATLAQLIELEKQRLQIMLSRQQVREKEIDANTKLAEKSIDAQAAHLKTKPSQDRKTIALFASIIIILILLFCFFICYLISSGNKDFAKYILVGLSHVAFGVIGYFTGKKSSKPTDSLTTDDIPEAEIID